MDIKIKGGYIIRELNIGSKEYTRVVVLDEKGAGNANHNYHIEIVGEEKQDLSTNHIVFQNGVIKENGVNGCQIQSRRSNRRMGRNV